MRTQIRTSFGLALMLALGILLTMLALGMFSTVPVVRADVADATVKLSPDKARDIAQYTVKFTVDADVAVGQRVFVTFPSGTTVPSSISSANITIKADHGHRRHKQRTADRWRRHGIGARGSNHHPRHGRWYRLKSRW